MFSPDLPPAGAAALAAVRELVSADRAAAMTSEERAAWLVALQQLRDAIAAAELSVVAPFDANGDGETLHCARSTASWMRGALRISGAEATRRVRLARQGRSELSATVAAMAAGEVTSEQAHLIGQAVRDLPPEHVQPAVKVLTDLAKQTGVADVALAARRVGEAANPDGSLTSCERDFARRRLYVSPMLDGMFSVNGVLDPEAGAALTTALQPFLTPAGSEDDRDTAQRRADGLVALADVAMSQAALPITGGSRPTLNVVTTLESLRLALGAQSHGSSAAGATTITQTGSHLGGAATGRIACDAHIARVLVNPAGVPLELGRSQRLFSSAQRQLLSLRDGGCRFPGCDLPPAFTDAHHLVSWADGGPTNLSNGFLVCRFHHRHLHEGGWRVDFDCGEGQAGARLTFRGPRGQTLRSTPRNLSREDLDQFTWWHPPDS